MNHRGHLARELAFSARIQIRLLDEVGGRNPIYRALSLAIADAIEALDSGRKAECLTALHELKALSLFAEPPSVEGLR